MVNRQKIKHPNHFLSLNELSEKQLFQLIERAVHFKKHPFTEKKRHSLYAVNCFFEDSTRTHKSFEMAERKLGMQVIDFHPSTSSVKKGESLYDTVMTLQAIGVDLIVIRHPQEAFYEELIQSSLLTSSIANGGDGSGEHPSQSLLDLMTIYEEFHTFKGLKVAISGDLIHSRVARSNGRILRKLGAEVWFTGPEAWMDPTYETFGSYAPMDDLVGKVDVMMLLRVQHERHKESHSAFSKKGYLSEYGLTSDRAQKMKSDAIIMHPAPVNRDVEIASNLVESSRSRIFKQMENGVYARMAIIDSLLQ